MRRSPLHGQSVNGALREAWGDSAAEGGQPRYHRSFVRSWRSPWGSFSLFHITTQRLDQTEHRSWSLQDLGRSLCLFFKFISHPISAYGSIAVILAAESLYLLRCSIFLQADCQ